MGDSEIQPPTSQTITTPPPQNTADSERAIPALTPPTPPYIPPSPPEQKSTHTCKPDQTPWWKVLLEVTALLAVIAYTIAAWRQLGVMSGQLTEMQRSTRAAREAAYTACVSAQIARSTLVEVQNSGNDSHNLALGSVAQAIAVSRGESAQLKFILGNVFSGTTQENDHALGQVIGISNVGRTSAMNIKGRIQIEVLEKGTEPIFKYPTPSHLDTGELDVGETPEKRTYYVLTAPGKHKRFTQDEINEIRSQVHKSTFTYGRMTYSDIFGVKHWVQVCRIMASEGVTLNSPPIPKCASYNKTDTNQVIPVPQYSSASKVMPDDIKCVKPEGT
jgi:hypothetical protein